MGTKGHPVIGWGGGNSKEQAIGGGHKEATSQIQNGDHSPGWEESPKENMPLRKYNRGLLKVVTLELRWEGRRDAKIWRKSLAGKNNRCQGPVAGPASVAGAAVVAWFEWGMELGRELNRMQRAVGCYSHGRV